MFRDLTTTWNNDLIKRNMLERRQCAESEFPVSHAHRP